MMRPFLLAAALLLAAVPCAAGAQEPETMRDLAFGEFTRNAYIRELPVRFRIPAGYVAVSPDGRATRTYWTSPADSAAQAADPEHRMRDGFYSVTLSLNVGYDVDTDRFIGGESDETRMQADFEGQGFTGVSLERHLINGYPVLFVEAEKDGRRAMMVYVASLVDTNVVFAFYAHPDPFRELDRARWAAFKDAILASPPPAPPTR
jgi:hypothetical protein